MTSPFTGMEIVDRMLNAVEVVRLRLSRAAGTLEAAEIPYAVLGDNAVAAWVATVDPSAVRFTQDVDILLRRPDLDAATPPMEAAGFHRRHAKGVEMFLDGPDARARDAVHIRFAGEKVRPDYATAAPDVSRSEPLGQFRVLRLEALVTMKLTSFRTKDQRHQIDMVDVGLLDETWVNRLSPDMAGRLRGILATHDREQL